MHGTNDSKKSSDRQRLRIVLPDGSWLIVPLPPDLGPRTSDLGPPSGDCGLKERKLRDRKSIPLCDQPYKDTDPLTVFVVKSGGVSPDYARGQWRGELERMREGHGFPPGTFVHHPKLTLEECTEWAFAHGYIYRPEIDAFLEALEQDISACDTGRPDKRVYSAAGVGHKVELEWQRYNHNLDGEE